MFRVRKVPKHGKARSGAASDMPDSNSFTELAALISSHMPQGALESVNHEAIVAVEQTIHQSGRPELLRAYYSLLADIDTPVLPASSVDTRRPIQL